MKDKSYQTEAGRYNTHKLTVLYSIILTERGMKQNLKKGIVRFVDSMRERRCCRCNEWWPWDTEFYSPKQTHCRACEADRQRDKKLKLTPVN